MSSNEAASTALSRLNAASIAELVAAASPGPWAYSPERHTHDSPIHAANAVEKHGHIGADDGCVVGSSEWIWLTEGDGNLIAATPDIAARAIEAEERLRQIVYAANGLNGTPRAEARLAHAIKSARAFLGEES